MIPPDDRTDSSTPHTALQPPNTPMPDAEDSGEIIGLLQPYLDGELTPEDAASVERRLSTDASLRELVEEQLEVREALRSLEPAPTPRALQARILLELDAVDREASELESQAPARAGWLVTLRPRLRALARGAAVMLPASAAAAALFLLVQQPASAPAPNVEATPTLAAVTAADPAETPDPIELKTSAMPESGVPVQLANPGAARSASGIHLVGLEVPEAQPAATRRGWTARAVYQDARSGSRIVDLQQRARGVQPAGTRRMYRGRTFFMSSDDAGRPIVQFVAGGTLHQLSFTPSSFDDPGPAVLLELGHELATVAPGPR